jgi:hypothetical protein
MLSLRNKNSFGFTPFFALSHPAFLWSRCLATTHPNLLWINDADELDEVNSQQYLHRHQRWPFVKKILTIFLLLAIVIHYPCAHVSLP